MTLSIFLAQLLGLVMTAMAVVMIWRRSDMPALVAGFAKDRTLIFCAGLIELTAGLALVLGHNIWTIGWPVLITLIGWAMIIEGLGWLATPQAFGRLANKTMKQAGWFYSLTVFILIIGLWLVYVGFVG